MFVHLLALAASAHYQIPVTFGHSKQFASPAFDVRISATTALSSAYNFHWTRLGVTVIYSLMECLFLLDGDDRPQTLILHPQFSCASYPANQVRIYVDAHIPCSDARLASCEKIVARWTNDGNHPDIHQTYRDVQEPIACDGRCNEPVADIPSARSCLSRRSVGSRTYNITSAVSESSTSTTSYSTRLVSLPTRATCSLRQLIAVGRCRLILCFTPT